ncbi:MAG: hypothetical protein EBR09_13950, partial [Proteobacteria bacterium]|nr:hypothetical protein [Pseudomonadota bacterium]
MPHTQFSVAVTSPDYNGSLRESDFTTLGCDEVSMQIQGHSDAAWRSLAQLMTAVEAGKVAPDLLQALRTQAAAATVPTIGITGTGGAGKSSLTDELIRRFRLDLGD